MNPYKDILHLPHHVSDRHPPMSRENRAAQFAPFAALTGYDDAVRETARPTDGQIVQEEEEIDRLNRKLVILASRLDDDPVALITYFQPDKKKSGGAYRTAEGVVRRIDPFESVVELLIADRIVKIPMEAMIAMESTVFDEMARDDWHPDE